MRNGLLALSIRARRVLAEDRERGATALEYAGVIAIAAMIIGALALAINPGNLTTTVQNTISDILNPTPGGGG